MYYYSNYIKVGVLFYLLFWICFIEGSTCGEISIDESLDRIAESINQAHKKSKNVIAGKPSSVSY